MDNKEALEIHDGRSNRKKSAVLVYFCGEELAEEPVFCLRWPKPQAEDMARTRDRPASLLDFGSGEDK